MWANWACMYVCIYVQLYMCIYMYKVVIFISGMLVKYTVLIIIAFNEHKQIENRTGTKAAADFFCNEQKEKQRIIHRRGNSEMSKLRRKLVSLRAVWWCRYTPCATKLQKRVAANSQWTPTTTAAAVVDGHKPKFVEISNVWKRSVCRQRGPERLARKRGRGPSEK